MQPNLPHRVGTGSGVGLCDQLLPAEQSGSWWCVNGAGVMAPGSSYSVSPVGSPAVVMYDGHQQLQLNPTNVSQEQYLASAPRAAPAGDVTFCALATKGRLATADILAFTDLAGVYSWLAEDNGTVDRMYGLSSTQDAPSSPQWSEALTCLRFQASIKDASICTFNSDTTSSGCQHVTVTDSSIPAGTLMWTVGASQSGTAYNMAGYVRGAFLTESVVSDARLAALAAAVVIPSPPPGWASWTSGANANGVGSNSLVTNTPVTSWFSAPLASLTTAADFVATAPSGANDAGTPYFVGVEQSVAFDGIYNQVVSPGSGGPPLNFINNTGVFDAFIQLRRRNTSNGTERRIFGGSEGQAGLFIGQNTYSNTEGTFWVILGNGVGLVSNYRTTINAPLGQPTTLLVRGTGANLRVAVPPFTVFETAAFGASPGGGDAGYNYAIGAINELDTPGVQFFEGDVFQTLVYPSNNSGAYLAQASAYFAYRARNAATQTTWAALGDSLTMGATGIYPWPARITAMRRPSLAVANQGTSGDTAAQALVRWTNQIKNKGFVGLVLFIGINDIRSGTSAATTFSSISATVADALSVGMPVIVLTLAPFGTNVAWTAPRQVQWAALNASIRGLAGVTILDAAVFMADPNNAQNLNPAFDFGDGLHFNDTGFVEMANQVNGAIQ